MPSSSMIVPSDRCMVVLTGIGSPRTNLEAISSHSDPSPRFSRIQVFNPLRAPCAPFGFGLCPLSHLPFFSRVSMHLA
jgi:hypothetical protein